MRQQHSNLIVLQIDCLNYIKKKKGIDKNRESDEAEINTTMICFWNDPLCSLNQQTNEKSLHYTKGLLLVEKQNSSTNQFCN